MASVFPQALVFMKVGFHGDEDLEAILKRKAEEEAISGVVFWGYGGTLCHPTRQIRPFAERCKDMGLSVSVVMASTHSKFNVEPTAAKEFSEDGLVWQPLPHEVKVIASRHALIMRDLKLCQIELDLNSYVVAIGQSEGRRFSEYIRGRVDKGCAISSIPTLPRKPIAVAFTGVLVSPYAVFVR